MTLRSIEMFMEYEPGTYVGFISPTPLMMVVALGDHLTVADQALAAYERALAPKRLVTLPSGHFDAYVAGFCVTGRNGVVRSTSALTRIVTFGVSLLADENRV